MWNINELLCRGHKQRATKTNMKHHRGYVKLNKTVNA